MTTVFGQGKCYHDKGKFKGKSGNVMVDQVWKPLISQMRIK